MTVRKTKPKSSHNTPEKTAKRTPPAKQNTGSQELQGWISKLEAEFLRARRSDCDRDLKAKQRVVKVIRELVNSQKFSIDLYAPSNREELERLAGDLPKDESYQENFSESLAIIWSDSDFWKLMYDSQQSSDHKSHEVNIPAINHLISNYDLRIPFSPCVWFEMVGNRALRDYLFFLMLVSAPEMFWVQSPKPCEKPGGNHTGGLTPEMMGNILNHYMLNTIQDSMPFLKMLVIENCIPGDAQRQFLTAVNKLAEDLAYIIKFPERFDARRKPLKAHRPRELAIAQAKEKMVDVLRLNHTISDNALAQRFYKSTAGAYRTLAKQARTLALYRDKLPIK